MNCSTSTLAQNHTITDLLVVICGVQFCYKMQIEHKRKWYEENVFEKSLKNLYMYSNRFLMMDVPYVKRIKQAYKCSSKNITEQQDVFCVE